MQSNVKHNEITSKRDRPGVTRPRREGVKIYDGNCGFFIPLSVCMSKGDQRWRNVT